MISYIFNRNAKFNLSKILNFSFFALFLLLSVNVNAQDAVEAAPAVSSEVAYILNTFLFFSFIAFIFWFIVSSLTSLYYSSYAFNYEFKFSSLTSLSSTSSAITNDTKFTSIPTLYSTSTANTYQ